MKALVFKNKFDKFIFFLTSLILFFYILAAFVFSDSDTRYAKKVPDQIPLVLFSDPEMTQRINLPYNNNKSPDLFTVYTKLPGTSNGNVIEFHGRYKSLSAKLDGKTVYTSEIPSFLGLKTYAGRNSCFIPVDPSYSEKKICLEISLQDNLYGASFQSLCLSTLATYISGQMKKCIPSYVLSLLLFICSLFSLNAFLFSYLYQRKRAALDFYIAIETFLVSLSIVVWIVTNYDVLGMIVGNMALVGILNYLSFTCMPIFFTSFLYTINPKDNKLLNILKKLAELNLAVQFLLFILQIFDFTQMLILTHIIDIIGVVMTIIVVFDFASLKKFKVFSIEQKFMCFGSAIFALFVVISLILFIFKTDLNYMLLITIGFLLLFAMHMVTSLLKLNTSLKEHAKLLESERNSYRDQLTSLGNRRLYYRKVAKLEAMGFEDDVNIIMIDVNGLKVTNDTLGHDAGDELLVGTAVCMTEAFPDAELLCRLGGDEFCIILQKKPAVLEKRMNRFLAYAENWNGSLIKSISMSYGIANRKKYPGFTVSELLKAADEEMYEYKTNYYKHKNMLEDALEGRR